MKNLRKNKSGISLIVLVITIIVMIILAAAIILSLSNSGIIGKANKAKTDTDVASAKDIVAMAHADWMLDEAKIMTEDSSITSFGKYAEKKLKEAGYKIDGTNGSYTVSDNGAVNTLYVEESKTVVIPEGFTYVEGTMSEGVVIQDNAGNEFVWIPVDDFSKFERTTTYNGTITDPGYAEPYTEDSNDTTGERAEYVAMRSSVKKYGGFYIGRYEAGSTVKRENKVNGTTEMVVKKDVYPYNYVVWGVSMTLTKGDVNVTVWEDISSFDVNRGKCAVELSRNMYSSSNSVVSTLTYGVQWDAALTFISKEDATYATNSEGKGNYTGNLKKTGSSAEYKICYIYDMAGNVFELTMEVNSTMRMERGGSFAQTGQDMPAGIRMSAMVPGYGYEYMGFRPSLYLK